MKNNFNLVWLDIEDITPYENNPRNNHRAIEEVAESMRQFGFRPENAILLDKNHVIVNGDTRYHAAKLIGIKKIPCFINEQLTEDELNAFRIADNKVSEYSTWDYDKLKVEINELNDEGFDVTKLGFTFDTLDELLSVCEEDNQFFQGKVSPDKGVSLTGDKFSSEFDKIYTLGNDHRLLVCKATDSRLYSKLLYDGKATFYFVDFTNEQFGDDQGILLTYGAKELSSGNSFYVKTNNVDFKRYLQLCDGLDLSVNQLLIWVQTKYTNTGEYYSNAGTPIIYGCKSNGKRKWYNDRKQANVLEFGNTISDVASVDLVKYLISNSTDESDIVFDNFGHIGTTVIACQILGRRSRIVVDSVVKADLIRKRWAEFVYGENCDWESKTPELKRGKK